jgi:DNA polymerase I-like protein with 3'-5' exonuclease and polymerase domains
MTINPKTQQAYQLFHNGILALARAERQGIRLDIEYTEKQIRRLSRRIERSEREFLASKLGRQWGRVSKREININSNTQLANFLYHNLNYTPVKYTPSGQGSTDDEALRALDIPELDDLLHARKLKKIRDYLELFYRESVDGIIHPVFNLHFARTFRSSSDSPNFQNIPKRDAEAMEITRSALFPRPGHQLLEVDYGGLEVRIAACYHKDENMLEYINNPDSDMHTDMAKQIFKIDVIDKNIPLHNTLRQAAKNGFVFPQFYGDYYKNNAEGICNNWIHLPQRSWRDGEGIEIGNFEPVFISDHLRNQGIKSFNSFVKHLEEIENDFWGNRFKEYAAWKERWWKSYQKYGYIDMKTGFRCSGVMSRNDCINYPVQGAAFHCLLWSLIQLDVLIYFKEKLDSKIIGQIHDSIVIDANPNEVDYLIPIIRDITCRRLREEWDWIIVPLEIDIELHPVDGSWADKL